MSLQDTKDAGDTAGGTESSGSPFAVPAFGWFFTGRFVSLLGSSMGPIALTLAVLNVSGSVRDLGLVLTAQTVPLVAFSLVGGIIGDRFSRRLVLIVANLGAGLTQGVVATLLISGRYHLGALMALTFVNGALTACTAPALRGIVPDIVGRAQTQRANSALAATRSATKIMGPTAGAVIVVAAGGGWAIAIDAMTYLIAALCLARLPRGARMPAGKTGVIADLREGWSEFTARSWVWAVVVSFTFTNFINVGIWTILGPAIARGTIGETAWGVVLSAKAAGVLLMSLIMYRMTLWRLLPVGLVCISLSALPLIALGTGVSAFWLAATTFVAGLGMGLYAIAWETSLQQHIPKQMLSRISSYDNLGSFAAIPLGQLAVIPAAAAFGAPAVATVGGLLYGLLALAPLVIPDVRALRSDREPARRVKTEDRRAGAERPGPS
jgi:MFS family permease